MADPMICPKCGGAIHRRPELLVVPAAVKGLVGMEISDQNVLAVQASICSQCRYVEFYQVPAQP